MSGLRKAKKYDWKDSNLALFGSDTEKNIKKESAATEPAWQKAGQEVGIQIWRIVNFKVTQWPKEDYGKFYNGDSYIILNTYKDDDEEELQYDVHFWIGSQSTQDEYGTAAYKTVELDTFLNDKPVQHREVQGFESDMFKSYFKTITIMKGGADTGFRKVKPEEYTPRLLHFSGTRKNVEVREVTRNKKSLNSGDVFILDQGLKIYQWNGSGSNKDERMKAMQFLIQLKSERNGRPNTETLDEGSTEPGHDFFKSLDEEDDGDDDVSGFVAQDDQKELYRLSDASGQLNYKLEKKGDVSMGDFDTKDVFLLDTKKSLFVWIGKGASEAERRNAMGYAHNFLQKTNHPLVPVCCLAEGGRQDAQFQMAIAA
ncbi:gelsolin-like protein 2 [Ruditapes philippinarum]|uniref:gelsolin-like protein 2 n=1 Tax=Ruditapes philippinarum TaxID=129788 RepID=UPI00295BD1C7|nr:gelsolin-like protein 2 [Ruditapes philippinarum]